MKKFLFHTGFPLLNIGLAAGLCWLAIDFFEIPAWTVAFLALLLHFMYLSDDMEKSFYEHLFGKKDIKEEAKKTESES